MQPNLLQDGTTLLTYSLTTVPMPVQVSFSTTSVSYATLIFVISCPRSVGSVTVGQIKISLPVDGSTPDATNLCMTAPPLSSASISSSQWTVSGGTNGNFTFTPTPGNNPAKISSDSLTIEFRGIPINTLVGTALVSIKEWASDVGDPPPVTQPPSGTQSVAVAKFPYGFYAGNFTSKTPLVQYGQSPELSWSGSVNATYKMYYDSNDPVDVTNVRTWSPPNGLTQMTTFILRVSAQEGDQTATINFNLTVEVANPSLTATNLTVLQGSTLQGAVNVGASGTPANLVVNGDVQAKNNLAVVGPFNAQADANVAGKLDVTLDATLRKDLNVTGKTRLSQDLTVTGPTSLQALTAFTTTILGPVNLLSVTQYQPGTFTAPTDGFVIGAIYPISSGFSNATIQGSSNNVLVQATGGGVVSCPGYTAPLSGTFILPVKKGLLFTIRVNTPANTTPPPPPPNNYAFYFVALGTGAVSLTARKKRTAGKKLTTNKKLTAKKPATTRAVARKTVARKRKKG